MADGKIPNLGKSIDDIRAELFARIEEVQDEYQEKGWLPARLNLLHWQEHPRISPLLPLPAALFRLRQHFQMLHCHPAAYCMRCILFPCYSFLFHNLDIS